MQLLSVTSHFISQPSTRYGYFRDALYYLACSEHLAFGYVDQPPLIAVLGWFTHCFVQRFEMELAVGMVQSEELALSL